MPERLSGGEQVRVPEKPRKGRIPAASMWVASGILDQHAGKKKVESVDAAVAGLPTRKPEDLAGHHEKVGAFSTKQRSEHWDAAAAEDPRLSNTNEQVMRWQDGVVDYLATLQDNGKENSFITVLETLGVDQIDSPEAFQEDVRRKIEQFRQKFLVGPSHIDAFAAYFTEGRSLEENLQAVENAEGFFGVFGGKETVQLVKDAVIAHAFTQDMQQGGRQEELLQTAKDALAEELPEETAGLYGMLYAKPVDMKPGEEHVVAIPLTESEDEAEPAPLMPPSPEEEHTEGLDNSETQQSSGESEEGKVLSYREFQQAVMDKELGEYPELADWFSTESAKLPEMTVEVGEAPLTNGKDWQAEFVRSDTGDIEGVQSVTNTKHFFSLEGVKISTPSASWTQPGLLEDTAQVEIETAYGKVQLQTSGFVGVVKDREGNILVGLGQEPLSDTPNHVVVKDPLQTSIGKFLLVMGDPANGIPGDPGKDKSFYDTLSLVFPGENPFQQFLDHLKQPDTVWAMGAVNGNRLRSSNISFEIVVDDAQKEALALNGKNRWVTEDERKALQRAGLLNLIGTGAFTAV